jgi:hypothetical protein
VGNNSRNCLFWDKKVSRVDPISGCVVLGLGEREI